MFKEKWSKRVILGVFVASMFFCGAAYSLTILKTSLEELTRESTIIVHGKIEDIDYSWHNQSTQIIHTNLTVRVNQYLKGSGDATIVVKQLGGRIGEIGMEIPGTPEFQSGDEVILFLVEYKGDYWIHSITLGAFDVLAENDGAKFILNDLSGINIIDPATHQPLQPEEAFSLTPIDNFITDIKTYVEKE